MKTLYNYLNLPARVSDTITPANKIEYIYTSAGEKLKQRLSTGTTLLYFGNYVYTLDGSANGIAVKYILTQEGRATYSAGAYTYEYFIKDHLGNVRVSFKDSSNVAVIIQKTDYYPFGMMHKPQSLNRSDNRYLYNGKELQDESLAGVNLDWYDFNLRYYDPQIARFTTMDPLAEERLWISPYNFVQNNPINRIDPSGALDWEPDSKGNLIAEKGDNAYTLSTYLNISRDEAQQMIDNQNVKTSITIPLIPEVQEGEQIKLDNVFTRNLSSDANLPSGDRQLYYNCWGSACAGVNGNEIKVGVGIDAPVTFDNILNNDFESVSSSNAKFGKTILRFTSDKPYAEKQFDAYEKAGLLSRDPNAIGGSLHGAVYYGKSNNGTIYIYSKNGWAEAPRIMRLNDLENNSKYNYGTVRGLNGNSGYYNKK